MGFLGDIIFGHTSSKIGEAMADNALLLPQSDASWERLADRYGVPLEQEGALETFVQIVDETYHERLYDNGMAEADDERNSKGFWGWLTS